MRPVLPTYLAIDCSSSMAAQLPEVQGLIWKLQTELLENPIVADRVRLAVLTFNDSPSLALPLADLTEVDTFPSLRAVGGTQYGPIMSLLTDTITRDLRLLRHRSVVVMRPLVIFITDGVPLDSSELWSSKVDMLKKKVNPHIVAVGLPGADEHTLRKIGTLHVALVKRLAEMSELLSRLLSSITHSVIALTDANSKMTSLGPPDLEVW